MNYKESDENIEHFRSSFKRRSGFSNGLSIGVILIIILVVFAIALFIYIGTRKGGTINIGNSVISRTPGPIAPPAPINGGTFLRKFRR